MTREDRALTVSIDALLVGGEDHEFRELIALLFAASGRLQAMRRELSKALSVSIAEFSVLTALMHLQQQGNVRVRTIADHLHVAAAQVTAIVMKLEASGWVEKSTDPADNRAVSLRMTPLAFERLNAFAPTLRRVNDRWFEGMSAAELIVVKDFLRRLVRQFEPAVAMAKEDADA